MTDKLRQAAQAVVDESFYLSQDSHNIHELKDALTEPSPIDALIAEIQMLRTANLPHNIKTTLIACQKTRIEELEADRAQMIAEIDAIVTCAEIVEDDEGVRHYIGEAYAYDEVQAILDKYRGVK